MRESSSVSAARAFERLVRGLSTAGLSTSSLVAELAQVEWTEAGAVAVARALIVEQLERVASAIRAFATEHQVSPEHVARNLLGGLTGEPAAVVYLTLAAPSVRIASRDGAWRRQLVAGANRRRWRGGLPLAWRLAVEQRAPRSEDLASLLRGETELLLVASLLHARDEDAPDARARLLAHFADPATVQNARLERLVALWTMAALPRLPISVLEDLPVHAGDAIYLAPVVRSTLFDARRRRTRAATAATEETSLTASLKALDELRDYLQPNIAAARLPRRTLSNLEPTGLPPGIARACLRVAIRAWQPFRGRARDAARDEQVVLREYDARVVWAVLHTLLSAPPARRCAALAGLSLGDRKAVLRALPQHVFPALFGVAKSPDERVALLEAAREVGDRRLEQMLEEDARWLAELSPTAVPRFAKLAGTDGVLHAIERLGAALPYQKMPRHLAQNIGKRLLVSDSESAAAVFSMLARTPAAVGWVARHGGPKIRSAVFGLTRMLDDPDDPTALEVWEALTREIVPVLSRLDELTSDGISTAAFDRLCSVLAEVRPTWGEQALRVTDREHGRVLWHAVVRAAGATRAEPTQDVVVPPLLLEAIRASDSAVGEAAREAPARFAPEAYARLPFTDLLRHAFVSLALGRWLDGRLTVEERRTHLAWVREAYANTPTRAAAYELAMRCSLADSHLLFRLARRAAAHHGASPDATGRAFDELYHTHALPKRSGGTRTITAPHPALKRVQRRILDRLLAGTQLHTAATGFRRGHSTTANAKRHVGRKLVVNVDVESCFPSTGYTQILRACRIAAADDLSPRAVRLLAELCSYGGALPTGAPTSPALLNIVLRRADAAIASAAGRFNITYSRYADDLTFSGDGDVHRILPFVERVLAEAGLSLAAHKVNLFRRGRRQMVTGLVVNEKANLPRRLRRRLRAAVHARTHGRTPEWHGHPMTDAALLGHLANLGAVQPAEAGALAEQVRATMEESSKTRKRPARRGRRSPPTATPDA